MSNNSTAEWAETTVPEVVTRQAKATATDCLPGTVGCSSVCPLLLLLLLSLR